MTSAPIEVEDWLGAKSFSPRMTASLGLSVPEALALLGGALTSQGFKVKDATDRGFRASWVDKWALLGIAAVTDMDFKRTRLAVTAEPSEAGTSADGRGREGRRAPRRPAARTRGADHGVPGRPAPRHHGHHHPLGEVMTTGPSDDELLPGEHPPFDQADEADVLEQELEVPDDDDEDYERG